MAMQDALSEITLFGQPMVNSTREDVCDLLLDGGRRRVAFLNADCINIAARNDIYRNNLDTMDMRLPDGSGLALAAAMVGEKFSENLNGTDLFPILCREASVRGKSIFFLGGAPGVAEMAAARAAQAHEDLVIAGFEDGYFGDEAAVVERINASGADILLVAMGAPLQEAFIAKHSAALKPSLCMGVGGLFDFVSGMKARAPKAFRAVGMEWLWRLGLEPVRLARRYLIGNPVFIARSVHHSLIGRRTGYELRKRVLDVTLASMAMVVLAPFFLLAATLIMVESRGGAFFTQTRVGKNGKTFRMIKFRTMHPDAEARLAAIRAMSDRDSVCFKMANDPRVTRVGRILRKTSLDEFPQLLNVIKGDMALVGPRPALPAEVEQYSEAEVERLAGAPGITCLWQISGRADLKFDKQVDLDVAYLQSASTLLDIAIIILTPLAMISRRGAY